MIMIVQIKNLKTGNVRLIQRYVPSQNDPEPERVHRAQYPETDHVDLSLLPGEVHLGESQAVECAIPGLDQSNMQPAVNLDTAQPAPAEIAPTGAPTAM